MPLSLVYYDNPILRQRSLPIESISEEIRTLVQEMMQTMDVSGGVGLAAPQVGYNLRLFVARFYVEGENTFGDPRVYINPQLSAPTEEKVLEVEGCLSIPGLQAKVLRPVGITISAIDLEGRAFQEEIRGYNARILMHENDHLNGVLYIDRLDPATKRALAPKLRAIKQQYATLPKR